MHRFCNHGHASQLNPTSCIDRRAVPAAGVVGVAIEAADGAVSRRRVEERGGEGEGKEDDGEVQQGEEAQRGQQGPPAPALYQGPHRDDHPAESDQLTLG